MHFSSWMKEPATARLGIAASAAALGAGAALYFWAAAGASAPSVAPAALARAPVTPGSVTEVAFSPLKAPGAVVTAFQLRRSGEIDIAPVIADGGLHVVLLGEAPEQWLDGPPRFVRERGVTALARPLNQAGLAQVARVLGTRLRLYRADGGSCLARVSGATALARMGGGAPREEHAAERDAWQWWEGGQAVVAGDLEPLEGSCEGALWARTDSLPPVSFAPARKPNRATRRAAIEALRALPWYGDAVRRSRPGESIFITSRAFDVVTVSTRDVTIVAATLVGKGCDGWWPIFGALWRLESGGRLRLVTEHFPMVGTSTELLVGGDADGDGRLEFLARDPDGGVTVLRKRPDAERFQEELGAPNDRNLHPRCARKLLADE